MNLCYNRVITKLILLILPFALPTIRSAAHGAILGGTNMIQKIIKVGNSAAVTIPKEFLLETGIRIGDEMIIETNTAT
ncbi:hypothetical protein A3D03_04700 [Candidatus Gottesmanbacteria bacterium RIFCSPHIGHO2_02_FULL_40_13]|uniref:SpoVT-AbrB domain-containing protein n=1 Tax=Candidatus Gottesmanbacteria bacterium RIFCSPHIGHO2_02_FULL_40_13 TaxID=1798384 RepID=A0A1F6ABX4_9BACT|nr:MAG: hypothetical protein A3D03_04700 [Candidatus Gottesmanbacteria bacterium RIFCSPHIGHO2_02_FULL_40_13]